MLAQAVYAQDRAEEADALCRVSERIAAPEDIGTQVVWRGVRARILARGGDTEEGETLAREAVRLAEPTDQLVMQADALLDLADVLEWAGKPAEAEAALRRALELYERKGDIVSAARARSVLGAASDPQVRVR